MEAISLDQYEALAKSRRATRHFSPGPIDPETLTRLLDIARWAPSGYNLQPTHMVAVTDPALKPALRACCMNQTHVEEASATIVFAGDRHVKQNNLEQVIAQDSKAGAMTPEYEKKLRHFVRLAFDQGPVGFGWLWKALVPPIGTYFTPIPSIPAVHKRYWVTKQVMLAAMNLMLAAQAAGFATVPMEGFDERRVKKLLGIPRSFIVPIVIALGHPAGKPTTKSRLPLETVAHYNGW